jgi:heptaprenyl diphosphate synthase
VSRGPTRRGGLLAGIVSARALFAAGALVLPAFLFQQDLAIRGMEILLFLVLNAAGGRRIRIVQILVVSAGIVLFNLLVPTGRVLLSVAGLPVTEVALRGGVAKAGALVGMIAISQFCLREDLRIPGRVGGLVGRSLFYFQRIMGMRARVDRKDIVGSIDALLEKAQSGDGDPSSGKGLATRTTPGGALALAAVVAATWGPLVYTLVRPRPFW